MSDKITASLNSKMSSSNMRDMLKPNLHWKIPVTSFLSHLTTLYVFPGYMSDITDMSVGSLLKTHRHKMVRMDKTFGFAHHAFSEWMHRSNALSPFLRESPRPLLPSTRSSPLPQLSCSPHCPTGRTGATEQASDASIAWHQSRCACRSGAQ